MSTEHVPVLDFGGWFNKSDDATRLRIGSELASACREFGFVQLINHGLSQEVISDALSLAQDLFALPMDQKMLAPHPPGFTLHRGYSSPGLEKANLWKEGDPPIDLAVLDTAVKEAKESYEVGSENNLDQPNIFLPDSVLPGFRDKSLALYQTLHEVSMEIIRALALGIELSAEGTAALLAPQTGIHNQLRFLHYLPVSVKDVQEGRAQRLPPHTDWGTITLLMQDERGGLQVESPRAPGTFFDVEHVPGAICVNICDALMRRTNDQLKSTLHRVVLPSNPSSFDTTSTGELVTKSRHSVVYFVAPDLDTMIDYLPGCSDDRNPPKYKKFLFRDYVRMRASTMYK